MGAGLGLVAACGWRPRLRVLILDQENRANVGGRAFWSFGGLFLSNSPEQRTWASVIAMSLLCRIGWGRRRSTGPDYWPEQWAHARRFRGGGEAQLAAGPRAEDLSAGGLGQAWWLTRRGPQLGARFHIWGAGPGSGRHIRARQAA